MTRRSVAWDDGEAIPGTGALPAAAGPDSIGELTTRYVPDPHPELIAELTELYNVSPGLTVPTRASTEAPAGS